MSRVGEYSEEAGIWVVTKTKRVLYDEESDVNGRVLVIDTETFGRSLLIGKRLAFQTTERYDIYDEVLGNVPLNIHPSPKSVAIIGGGDGKIASIALKHNVEKVFVLEIDPKVIEAAKLLTDVFEDPRVEVIIGDAFETVETLDKVDIIIGDYSDPYPDEPAKSLLGERFITKLYNKLSDSGIVALQAGSPIFQKRLVKKVYDSLKNVFKKAYLFRSPMPVYPGAIWTYALSSKAEIDVKHCYRDIKGEFYSCGIHKTLFEIPPFIAELIERC